MSSIERRIATYNRLFDQYLPDYENQELRNKKVNWLANQENQQDAIKKFFEAENIDMPDQEILMKINQFVDPEENKRIIEAYNRDIAEQKRKIAEHNKKIKQNNEAAQEEQRINREEYEKRVRTGYKRYKGEELAPWYANNAQRWEEESTNYLKDNDVSIEEMENYLKENDKEHVMYGGTEQKWYDDLGDAWSSGASGFYRFVQALGEDTPQQADNFLGRFEYALNEADKEVDLQNQQNQETIEYNKYDPELYVTRSAEIMLEVEKLENELNTTQDEAAKAEIQTKIDTLQNELPPILEVKKQDVQQDILDLYDEYAANSVGQIGSDGEGRGLFGGREDSLLDEDGNFVSFESKFGSLEDFMKAKRGSEADYKLFRRLHELNKDSYSLEKLLLDKEESDLAADYKGVYQSFELDNNEVKLVEDLAAKYKFDASELLTKTKDGKYKFTNKGGEGFLEELKATRYDLGHLFDNSKKEIEDDYDNLMRSRGYVRNSWWDDEYIKTIVRDEELSPEVAEYIRQQDVQVQLNPAALGYYEKYLNTSKLEELTELVRENKIPVLGDLLSTEDEIAEDDELQRQRAQEIQNTIDEGYMEAVAQDPVIMAKLKQISEARKPELEAYKKELMLEHGDDYVKINELLDKKQNELVLDDLVNSDVYKKRASEIGLAFGELGHKYNADFVRQQSGFTRFMDAVYNRHDFDSHNPLNWLGELSNGIGSGIEGMSMAIGDSTAASFNGYMSRVKRDKIKQIDAALEAGEISDDDLIYFDITGKMQVGDGVLAEKVSDFRNTLSEKKNYWDDSITKQMKEMQRSVERLDAYGGADYTDGIGLQDIFNTVGNTLPHIAVATAGTLLSGGSAAPGILGVLSGQGGYAAMLAQYAGTITMGLQMYGDNYHSAIEANVANKLGVGMGEVRNLLREQNPEATDTEIEDMYFQLLAENYESGEGANIATSMAMAAAQTALESYGANQIVGSFKGAAKGAGVFAGGQLNIGNILNSTWSQRGAALYSLALARGADGLEEFGTEYAQEIIGMASTGIQSGEGAMKYISYSDALQAGIGGAISGIAIPFGGNIVTQSKIAIRNTAANIALKYAGNSKYAQKVKIANEWFEASKIELDNAYDKGSLKQEDYNAKMRELSNVRNAAIKTGLFGNTDVSSTNMTAKDKMSLLDLYIDMGTLDNEISMAEDNEPLQQALKQEKRVLQNAAADIIIRDRNAIKRAKEIERARKSKENEGVLYSGLPVFNLGGRGDIEMSAEELVADYELDQKQNDDYAKLERLRAIQQQGNLDTSTQQGFDRVTEAGAGIIQNAFNRLYQKGSLATPEQFKQELKNEFVKVFDSYSTDIDKNNLGVGKQTSNLFNLRANAVATRNIRQQGDTISMSDEKAPQIGDTTEQTDFDADELQDVGKREKKYMADNTKVTEAVGEEAASEIDRETSQEILREANKGKSPEGIAGVLARAFGQSTARGGRGLFNIIGKKVGTLNKGFKDFVDSTVDRDFIAALPAAFLKQSKPLQKILGIKNIGDTQVVKTDKDGKKTYSRPSVFAIPSDITDEQVQQVRDYFKSTPTSREGLLKRLSQEFALNSISKLKQDKDFMQKLQTALGDKQNALDFLNEIEGKLDQRTLEDTTKDITVPSKTMKQIIKLLDKGIKIFEAKPGQMRFEIIPGGGNAVAFVLKGIKYGLQQGLSFAQAVKRVVKQIKDYTAVTKEQKQIIDDQIGALTESDLDNYEQVQQIVETALAQVALDKYKNVAKNEVENVKKILKRRNVSKANKVKTLKNFFKFVNTSFQKNSKGHKLWVGDNAEVAFNYWQKEFGVDLGNYGFTLSDGKNKSILLDGKRVVDSGPLRPSNAPTNIQKVYTKKGFKGALEYVKNNIAKADQNSDDAINFIVDTVGDLVAAGKVDVAVQLLDTMGYASDSALRMVGKIRSIQDNVKTVDGKKSVEFEHTPPIDVLRSKIRAVLKTNQNVESIKQQIRDILNESYVDIIGKEEAKKLNTSIEQGGLGRKVTGETKARYDGVINQKNLIDIERGPEALVKEQKKATDKNADMAPGIVNKKDTPKKVKKTFLQSLKARINALKITKKRKGLSAFDFDDTLAFTKEKVKYTLPNGKKGTLTAAQFAVQYETLLDQGAEFDYSAFDNVSLETERGPLAGKALERQAKYGAKDIFVVTARPNASQLAIKTFLDSIGLNIPLENIITLEDGSPQVKADWLLSKAEQGYNDFYFADDSALNVQVVKDILSQIDVKSNVQQAIADKSTRLEQEMNELIEDAADIDANEEVSDVRAKLEGKRKDKGFLKRILRQFTITASADDFLGLAYSLFGKGDKGTRQQKWFIENFIKPYNKAEQALITAKMNMAADFNALKKAFPSLKSKKGGLINPLTQDIGVGPYNKSQAVRVYLWNKQGMDIPGISQADVDALVQAVNEDFELKQFADKIQEIQKQAEYPAPDQYWIAGDIKSDIMRSLDTTLRSELLTEFIENTDIAFSPKIMNKLEAAFGSKYVEALRDSLKRMKSGTNRPTYQGSGARQVNEMMDWLNGSVAVAMFVNMRSGLLQMLSNVNFINWGDNNIYAAAKAFASRDYVPTVLKLMNSDYLVNRRDGLKINVNEAELAAAANKGGFKGMLAYLLDKGFILTRIFDSLAIATGGAPFYINRTKSYLKQNNPATNKLYTKAEAEQKAFEDFYDIAENTQQSSNPSKISSQQASLFGRLILSFQNVTMQYNRKAKKMLLDLVNRRRRAGMTQRESDLSNLSGVIYYVGMQNLIFNALQQALFAVAFDDEEEKDRDKVADTINGMVDSLLFGLGFGGALVSTVKNVAREVLSQSERKSPKYEEAIWSLFDISPVIDSKIRNIRNGLKTFSWDMKQIKNRGWSLDNPAYIAISSVISGFTNIPIDRVFRKINNIRQATDENVRTFERIALLLGWSGWNFGLPYWGRESTIELEAANEEKLKEEFTASVKKAKADGFTKRVPFTGKNSWSNGIPKGLKEGVDYVAIKRHDGIIQYYKKP